jgi:opacity protein-like surface antigen
VASLVVASSLAQAARPAPEASFAFVAADTKLWTEPTRFGEAKALLKTGVELQVLEYSSNRDWVHVKTASGRTGWIPVRFTTQSGRRSFPLNAQFSSPSEGSRAPSSVEETPAAADASAPVALQAPGSDADSSKSWEGLLGLEYMNQLTREKTSGFGLEAGALHRLTNHWSVGGAFQWNRFSKGAELNGYTTDRVSNRLFPNVVFRYRHSDFRVDLGMGYALDRSSIKTRDPNGNIITTNNAGELVTGSGHESSLGLRVTPRYILPVSRLVKVGFYVSYMIDIALQGGEGDFASAGAISPPYSYLGAGMSVSASF